MRKRRDYLYQRPGSQNWYVRLQRSDGTSIAKSLGTPDRARAAVLAAPLIASHKQHLLDNRPRIVMNWVHDYEPGLHKLEDGGHVMATESTLTYTNAAGKITGTAPNGFPGFGLVGRDLPMAQEFQALDDAWAGKIGPGYLDEAAPLVLRNSSPDDALLETYITHAGLNPLRTKEARNIWQTFRRVINKPLAKCNRDDGRKLVAYLEAERAGIKAATLKRILVPLVALVNLAISEGKHDGINPFMGVVPDRNDSKRRLPFSDADMELMRANMEQLSEHDQLVVRVLATMGLRRGEAFAIRNEQAENGVRFTIVGTKTEQSLRRVPFPRDLLPHLPEKITRPLFKGSPDGATRRIGAWLRAIGIIDPAKSPMHSFRHRAQDKLRAAGCPQDIREELLGHERRTVAAGYGRGSPVPTLKAWLDKVSGP
jgi:integrase